MMEMPNEKLKGYASFSLSMCFFFDFFHNMFIVSFKTIIFISKLHECASFSLSMCFFSIFFTTCSLFLLKLPFLSQKASIFIFKLHECALVSLSMCYFFHCMFVVSSKVTIFISKSFDFYLQTP
ncbi:hypothetical protein D0Y65_038360 [Glycine soja]|uniref:Uncharacterized protein n=1 Tax=Glycine soja TaxID=3848 RepID=A0A445H4G9_GLYSO|nr:hypothetical protein D0Y65_038360 [Glycine soja]